MDTLNLSLTHATEWMLGWFGGLSPLVTLLVWSAVAGVLMALVYLYSSNQQALKTAGDRSRAQVLAIDLFGHDLGVVFSSLGQLLRYTGLRLWASLPPVLLMLVPVGLLLSQLALRYEHVPLVSGESTIVKLEMTEHDWPTHRTVTLEPSPEITLETPALHDPEERAIYWRLRAEEASPAVLRWRVGDGFVDKRVDIGNGEQRLATVSTRRPGRGWWDRFLHPAEAALPSNSPVRGIEIEHAPRETRLLGFNVPWWLTFLLASIVAALLMRPILKVRF
jgi:hypothetical protein